MSKTLVISDELYERLEREAQHRGLETVQQLLESWHPSEEELLMRKRKVDRINMLRHRLHQKYGEMPDSVDLIREDRDR